MSIKNQETLSQLSTGRTTGGVSKIDSINTQNNKQIDNYSNISIATAGKGQVVSQVSPTKKSTLAPKSNVVTEESYTAITYKNNLQ